MLETFNGWMDGLPSVLIYLTIAFLVFSEAALFFGFVFPGETAIIVGGLLASTGKISLTLLLVISIVAAIVGDSVGYEIGKKFGPRLLEMKAVSRHRSKVEKAQDLIRRRGAFAVFIGRFTALLRALMPALAGSARLPYGKFLVFNALGGIAWVLTFGIGGFYAAKAMEHVAHLVGQGLAVAAGAALVIGLIVYSVRKHRQEAVEEEEYAAERP
jgi:membrane protein DedA with SNARE-associated domain